MYVNVQAQVLVIKHFTIFSLRPFKDFTIMLQAEERKDI